MRPFRGLRSIGALVLMAGAASPVEAAWDNAFQVCCFGRRRECNRPVVAAYYAPSVSYAAPAACCPPPVCCTTQYVQRSYYQPVTCYQTKTYYEPVTSYRTSYYYEPVTSYRYSCYYDPCTCSYQQVACPTTCYRLRSQTCAVTSYLQRTCQVPVTSYRLSYYYEPVTSCYNPCAAPCANPAPAVGEHMAPAPAMQPPTTQPPPGVHEQRGPAGNGAPQQYDRYYPAPQNNPMPPANGNSTLRPIQPQPARPPMVRLDRIVSLSREDSNLQGQVVRVDNTPQSGAQITFVHADQGGRQEAIADGQGSFKATLPAGGWHVYLTGSDGKPVYHSRIDVQPSESRQVILVNR